MVALLAAGPALLASSCARTPAGPPAPASAPVATAIPADFQPSCEMDKLRAMVKRRICPTGSSPARLTAAEIEGRVHTIDVAKGAVIVEAEELAGASRGQWQAGTEGAFPEFGKPSGGFVMWLGGHCNGEENLSDPPPHTRQGSHEHWLVVKVEVPAGHEGAYRLMLRTSHRLKDGDNDLWAGRIGEVVPIKRAGFGPPGSFTWNKGPVAQLSAGTHAFYVAGRSACMGVDRLAVVKDDPAIVAALDAQP